MSIQITLPSDLEEDVRSAARQQGLSPQELVSQVIRDYIGAAGEDSTSHHFPGGKSGNRDLESGDNPEARRQATERTEATGEDF